MPTPSGITVTKMQTAFFIPLASPAMSKTQGVLTVNGVLTVCSCERENQSSRAAKTPD